MDLIEKTLKYTFFQPVTLINRVDCLSDLSHFLVFILTVNVFQIHLTVHLLDFILCRFIFLAVVVFESLSLLRARAFERFIDEPRAFIVLDISADLTNDFWDTEAIQIIVLHLKVLSRKQEDLLRLLKILRRGKVQLVQRKSGREEETVVRGLEVDDEAVLLEAELVEVKLFLWCSK